MAILTASASSGDGPITGWPLGDNPPAAGQQVAVCLDIKDTLGHERSVYEDPTRTEVVDLTRFLFGLPDGSMIQTKEMKISGHEKSALMAFLTGWLGSAPPLDGSFDISSMKGRGAQITIAQKNSQKGRTYADVVGISPVMEQLAAQVPQVANFTVPVSADSPSTTHAPASPSAPATTPSPAGAVSFQPQPAQPVQPVQPAQPVQPVQPAQPAQPAQPVQPEVDVQQTLGGFPQ